MALRSQLHKHTYVVRGRWPFPLDMLRHDGSRAASPADQAIIDRLSAEHCERDDDFRKRQEVTLTFDGDRFVSVMRPNLARWDSFSWRVVSIDGEAA